MTGRPDASTLVVTDPAGSPRAQQQVLYSGRCVFGSVFVLDPMFATRLRQMFAQGLGDVMATLQNRQRFEAFSRLFRKALGVEFLMHSAQIMRQAINRITVEQHLE